MPKKSFENPLIPHVRMRALYRALVETRAAGPWLGKDRLPKGLEACWVATSIALEDGDLTSDTRTNALPAYLRAVGARTAAGGPRATQVNALLEAAPVPFAGTAFERVLCATGAAMALQSAGERRIALAYVRGEELSKDEWKRLAKVAGVGDLPLIVVAAGSRALPPLGPGVPVIPVDAADSVAIYRVAQESILRARAECGLVVLECVHSRLDPVELLGQQLVAKGIATRAWLEAAQARMARLLPEPSAEVH